MAGQEKYMRQALRLAARGRGRVEPNPMVGAVLVRDDGLLAAGYHRRFGGPHAEVDALKRCRVAGVDPAGADLYVTLEPCCHVGKTPPCTDALIAAGVRRVFAAMQDPNPLVAGKGTQALRQAGLEVEIGLCEAEARALNEPYLKRTATGLPWVIAKWAQTVDGAVASSGGQSRWISGPDSRRFVHRLRARVDAVIVGIRTVLADDPLLTARDVLLRRRARRVVVDPRLRIPLTAKLLASMAEGPVTIATDERLLHSAAPQARALQERGVELLGLPPTGTALRPPNLATESADAMPPPTLDLQPLLCHLAGMHGTTNVLVEGGPILLGHLLNQRLLDQMLVVVSPRVLADAGAVGALAGPPRPCLADAQALRLRRVKRLGADVLLDYAVASD